MRRAGPILGGRRASLLIVPAAARCCASPWRPAAPCRPRSLDLSSDRCLGSLQAAQRLPVFNSQPPASPRSPTAMAAEGSAPDRPQAAAAAPPAQLSPPAAAAAAAPFELSPADRAAVQALAGPFPSFAARVRAAQAALRRLFDAIDAAGLREGQEPAGFWECMRGQPGIRLEPISWAELTSLLADGGEEALGALGRTPWQIKEYWDRRDGEILRQYASVADYLRVRVFGFATRQQPDGRLAAVVPDGFFGSSASSSSSDGSGPAGSSSDGSGAAGGGSDGSAAGGGISSTGRNGDGSSAAGGAAALQSAPAAQELVAAWRPNDFPYHLEPGIVHMNLWANRPLSAAEVEAAAAVKAPPGAERAWFVNTPSLQSVPAIWHAHVLWRQPAGAGQG